MNFTQCTLSQVTVFNYNRLMPREDDGLSSETREVRQFTTAPKIAMKFNAIDIKRVDIDSFDAS